MRCHSIHTRFRLALTAAALALAACADGGSTPVTPTARAAGPASVLAASTLTLVSGAGAIGGQDASNPVSIDGGATFHPAVIIPALAGSYGGPLPGTNWIRPTVDQAFGTSIYRATFTLPAVFTAPSMDVQLLADNSAVVRLNGNVVGAQPTGDHHPNYQDPADAYSTANAAFFQPGTNTLEIVVTNVGGPSGLDYAARVDYTAVTLEALCTRTRELVAHHGVANSLCVKLRHGSVQAYINEVRAQRGKTITAAGADELTGYASLLL